MKALKIVVLNLITTAAFISVVSFGLGLTSKVVYTLFMLGWNVI